MLCRIVGYLRSLLNIPIMWWCKQHIYSDKCEILPNLSQPRIALHE